MTTDRSGRSFTPRQQATRRELLDAGAQRLLTQSVQRLLASVAPAALAEACGVSPDTVHRLVGGREETIELVVRDAVTNLDYANQWWPTFADVTDDAATAFVTGLAEADDKKQAFQDGLKVYIEANFATPARPAGTMVEAALMAASPRWSGPDLLDAEDRRVAERLRGERLRQLRQTTEGLGWLLAEAMALMERRPQRGTDPDTLIVLLNCLVDGAVLRMYADPESLDVDAVVEAVFRLGMAFTEPGSFEDPHEPDDPTTRRVFGAILDEATALWHAGADVTLQTVADASAELDLATVERWFPTVRELADSVVRRKVRSVQPEPSEHPNALIATLESVLRRLCVAADELPGAAALAFEGEAPAGSVAEQLREHALAVVESLGQPTLLAEQLVADACEGSGRWDRTAALLGLLAASANRPV